MQVYVSGGAELANLFLLDIESSHTNSYGRRIRLSGGPAVVKLEGKLLTGPDYAQPRGDEVELPTDRWVVIVLHLHLSNRSDGRVHIWQNGALIIDDAGRNLPFSDTVYDRLQIGITANATEDTQTPYIDDVVVSASALK